MLKHRIVTAAVLIPIVITVIYLPDPRWFSLFFAVFVALGAWEWAALCKFRDQFKYLYSFLIVVILGALFWANNNNIYNAVIILGAVYWSLAIFVVIFYQLKHNLLPKSPIALSLLGMILFIPMWSSLIYLKINIINGSSLIMFLMLLVWSADTGAYFFGKKWGKRKLASVISPGKTWEGTIAGIVSGMLVSFIYIYFSEAYSSQMLIIISICFFTILISVIGDLMESLVKREADIKDSGSILPGHGGVMDRIDSLTAAAPVFVSGMICLGFGK